MILNKCYSILKISKDNITKKSLRTAYFKQSLQYHPDKNKEEGSNEKFHEINDAYLQLMTHHGFDKVEEPQEGIDSYKELFHSFFMPIVRSDIFRNVIYKIIEQLRNKCEDKALHLLDRFHGDTYVKIMHILRTYKDVLHINDTFLQKMAEQALEKQNQMKVIRIFPSIDDLFAQNLYKLKEGEKEYLIPLWHHELIYEDELDNEFTVYCFPKLAKNVCIDELNDIHVKTTIDMNELWNQDALEVFVGSHVFTISKDRINMKEYQKIVLYNAGIPRIHTQCVYDVSSIGHVHVHIHKR